MCSWALWAIKAADKSNSCWKQDVYLLRAAGLKLQKISIAFSILDNFERIKKEKTNDARQIQLKINYGKIIDSLNAK